MKKYYKNAPIDRGFDTRVLYTGGHPPE